MSGPDLDRKQQHDPHEYGREYDAGVKSIRQHGSKSVTYHPSIGSCIDLAKPDERDTLFERLTDGGQPVYFISVTNNKKNFDEHTRNEYVRFRKQGAGVMLGQWTDINGITYRDVTIAISGIEREKALKYKRRYGQLSIVVLKKNDPPRFI